MFGRFRTANVTNAPLRGQSPLRNVFAKHNAFSGDRIVRRKAGED
jgi:hypothetical protein